MKPESPTFATSFFTPCEKASGARSKYVLRLLAQFGKPEGLLGVLAGKIMTYSPSNRERTSWTLGLLGLRPEDRVLEIGFGPGLAAEQASRIVTRGFVAGIDHSETMLRMARKRNMAAILEGRVNLQRASVSQLPPFAKLFTRILSLNSIQFWDDPVERLRELRQVLADGGQIAITLQPRTRGATDETALRWGREIVAALEAAGFRQVRMEVRRMKPVAAVCVLGINQGE